MATLGRPSRSRITARRFLVYWGQIVVLTFFLLLGHQALLRLQRDCHRKVEAAKEEERNTGIGYLKAMETIGTLSPVATELRVGLERLAASKNGLSAGGLKKMLQPYQWTSTDSGGGGVRGSATQRKQLALEGFSEAATGHAEDVRDRQVFRKGSRFREESNVHGRLATTAPYMCRGRNCQERRLRGFGQRGKGEKRAARDSQSLPAGLKRLDGWGVDQQRSRSLQQQSSDGQPIRKYYLSIMIFNRIFGADKLNFTINEAWQWLEYYRYAGVEHIYWYDCAQRPEEFQEEGLAPYVEAGLMTYHRFHDMYPGNFEYHYEQDNSEAHYHQHYRQESKWAIICDVDEYMFSLNDTRPGFLVRFLREVEGLQPGPIGTVWRGSGDHVSQVLVQNVFFKGWPRLTPPAMLIERYQRRDEKLEWNARTKTIVRTEDWRKASRYNPHEMMMSAGRTYSPPVERIRMNHYWGPRGNKFETESPEFLQTLRPDDSIQPIASIVRERLSTGAEYLAGMGVQKEVQRLVRLAAELDGKLQGVGRP